jgi:hypothetical protein
MTIIWMIYFTIQMIRNKDNKEDGILVMPCLILDAIISFTVDHYLNQP